MFNMSMIIVTLTGIVKLSPEQEISYNEICNEDPETVKKIKNEATVVIQSAWRHYLAKGIPGHPKFSQVDTKKVLKTRLEFTAIAKRYKYKRLNVANANPQLATIISDLKGRVNNFLESGMKNLNIYRTEITKQVGQMRENQFHMDSKMLKMYDATMKLNSFLVACNRNEVIEGKDFNKNKNLYTHRRAKMTTNHVKEFLALFKDAREPVNSFYEGFRPAERPQAKLARSNAASNLQEIIEGQEPDDVEQAINYPVLDDEPLVPSPFQGGYQLQGKGEKTKTNTYGEEEGEEEYEGEEESGEEEGKEEGETIKAGDITVKTEKEQTVNTKKTGKGSKKGKKGAKGETESAQASAKSKKKKAKNDNPSEKSSVKGKKPKKE